MKKLLPITLLFGFIYSLYGQNDPMSIHTIGVSDLNYIEFDSIVTYSDTAAGAMYQSAGKYIIRNRNRIVEGFANFQLVSISYISEQTPQAYIVYEITSFATNDTAGAYFFYEDQNGRDTSIVQAFYSNGVFTPTIENRYYYDSQGLIDSLNLYFYQSPTTPVKQVTQIYYRSNRLDSIYHFSFSAIPTQQPVKYYHTYGGNGRLLLIEGYRDEGMGYEVFIYSITHHNSFDEIIKIDSYSRLSGSQVFNVSQVVEFHQSPTFEIPENRLAQFAVYPNPSSDFIQIEGYAPSKKLSYNIYNLSGMPVKEGILNTQSIDISTLSNGTYILKFSESGSCPGHFRFIKN